MDTSVRALRWRRRRYALAARRRRMLLAAPLPTSIHLPGIGRLERHAYLYRRIRLPLWVGLAGAGWLLLGWAGMAPGLVAALLTETALSYRRPGRGARPWSGGIGGVREPRRPVPSSGAGAAPLPVDTSEDA